MKKEDIFLKIEKCLLQDEKPSVSINKMKEQGELDNIPFTWIRDLDKMKQNPKFHPEGSVWVHTMMVIDNGVEFREKVSDKRVFMWSLLLHDIGKLKTTKLRKGRWTSYDHDKVGEVEARNFLDFFSEDKEFINKVSKLVRYHMHLLYVMKNLPFGDFEGLKKEVDREDICYVFLCDRLGRGGITEDDRKLVEEEINKFKEKV